MEVAEAVPNFADAFAFDEFNEMQREVLPALLERNANVVASAPTASGKTALAELAICKVLDDGGTALFLAPMRALTNEKEDDWERFEELGYSVYVLTGERDLSVRRAKRADVLVMTPEKADSATRKHDSPRYSFISQIDCCVIDEVHLLDAQARGAALEATVSRLRQLCEPRIVALSATMANVGDVAAWLDAPAESTFSFEEEYRPVDLHADVQTYSHGENAFADKYRRLYAALDKAEPHLREDGQALVFVASRQDTVQAAKKAREECTERDIPMSARGDYDVHQESQQLENDTLRQSVIDGVAFHHAGLSKNDKDLVEEWFRTGHVELLFSTTTLAWGVNLPARCVVLRDTKFHDPLEGEVEMNPLDVLQMLGRAGRPGYDDVGYGWVICDSLEADRYRRLLREGTQIESRLAESLTEHLNAEIAAGIIEARSDVREWLETTFFAVRALRTATGFEESDLNGYAEESLDSLLERGFVRALDDGALEPTTRGTLASSFYLELETAAKFAAIAAAEPDPDQVLRTVASASEFDSVNARQDEREQIDSVVGSTSLEGGQRKVLAVLESSMRGSVPPALTDDAWVIRQNARRLFAALAAFFEQFCGPRGANLVRRLDARIENGVSADAVGLTAIDGVGSGRASKLASEGFETPQEIRSAGESGLIGAGLSEEVTKRVLENAGELPRFEIDWGEFPAEIDESDSEFHEITVRNAGAPTAVGIRLTVNGVEMTADETYLSDVTTIGAGVFGADESTLEFELCISVADEPLKPVSESRTVTVR